MTTLVEALRRAIGRAAVLTAEEERGAYSEDITENPPGWPDLVVTPRTAEEVVEVVRLAARDRTPITPIVAGYNVGGLAIPQSGGIVVDLTGLDRIHDLDRDAMYAVVEPGVSFGRLKEFLDEEAPELVYSYPFAPPSTSVLANALMDGLNSLSMRHGAMGTWINGLEVVLADGSVARTGSAAVSPSWFSRAPLPDLTGLFLNWQGLTGIALKGAVQLQPRMPFRSRLFVFSASVEAGFRLSRKVARSGSFDDIGMMTWPAAKMVFGATEGFRRDAGEPEAFCFLDYGGNSEAELAARTELLRDWFRGEEDLQAPVPAESLARMVPHLAPLIELPASLDFLLDFPGGGLTWVGSYGPTARYEEGARKGMAILEAHGFPPFLVSRPMAGGHYGVLRFVACFDKGSPESVEAVSAAMTECCEMLLGIGYVPYKAPRWAARRMLKTADPGFVALMRRVKEALDPHGIMNPGRWDLS